MELLVENKSLFGWKHPRAQILKEKNSKKKEMKEEEKGLLMSAKLIFF